MRPPAGSRSGDLGLRRPTDRTATVTQSQAGGRGVTAPAEPPAAQSGTLEGDLPENRVSTVTSGLLPRRDTSLARLHAPCPGNGATGPSERPSPAAADGAAARRSGAFRRRRLSLRPTSAGFRRNRLLRWPELPHQLVPAPRGARLAAPAGGTQPPGSAGRRISPHFSLAAASVGVPVFSLAHPALGAFCIGGTEPKRLRAASPIPQNPQENRHTPAGAFPCGLLPAFSAFQC